MELRKITKQKKGDMFQVVFALIIIFIAAVVGLLFLVLTNGVNDFWQESGLLNETAVGQAAIDTLQDTAPKTTDYAILFLFLGLNIGVTISAVRTNFSALTIIIFIFLTLISIMTAAGMVNMYQGLAQQETVLPTSSELTFTNFLFSKYLPLIVSIICAFVMIVMYGKSGGDIIT